MQSWSEREVGALTSTDERAYEGLADALAAGGVDVAAVEERLRAQRVETPSWGYGNSGTRFKVFPQEGVPRDPFEKFSDAAEVHRLTGICPSVAVHIPWDKVDDYGELRDHAGSLGVRIGAVNPNLFQEEEYRLGSVCHPDPAVRRQATDHLLDCVEIGRERGLRRDLPVVRRRHELPGAGRHHRAQAPHARCLGSGLRRACRRT